MARDDATQPPRMRTVAAGSMAGATLEWYDFLVYNTMAAVAFQQIFFSNMDPIAGTAAAFASFATGFVVRPLGGAVFGHLGDRFGRKKMLVATLLLAGGATTLIGLLPTYGQVGALAPVLLVILRLVQGFAIGGEFGGAILTTVEHAPRSRRGFWGAIPQIGVALGAVIATGLVNALTGWLSEPAFLSWGWRVPFLISFPLMAIGLFIRLRIQETPIFTEVKNRGLRVGMPLVELVRRQPGVLALTVGAGLLSTVSTHIYGAFAISYVGTILGLPTTTVLTVIMIKGIVVMFLLPAFGALSDVVGRRPVFLTGITLVSLAGFPFFWLVNTEELWLIWLALFFVGICDPLMFAVQGTFYSELFGSQTRFSGVSLAFQLAAVAGGFAPFVATGLFASAGEHYWPIATMLLVLGAISFTCVWVLSETMAKPAHERGRRLGRELLETT